MNKDAEKLLVEKVYAHRGNWNPVPFESPDFIFYTNNTATFGVEVTECYQSEIDARLQKIPSYFHEILDGQPFRHKDDNVLKVTEIDITDKEGKPKARGVKGIIRSLPTAEERLNRLHEVVMTKNAKCARYLTNAAITDLIIEDKNELYNFKSFQSLYYAITSNEKNREILTKSGFREILLVTKFENAHVVIPLKANIFAEHMLVSLHCFLELAPKFSISLEYQSFASFLSFLLTKLGLGSARIKATDKQLSVQFSSIDLIFDDEANGIKIHDNLCIPEWTNGGNTAKLLSESLTPTQHTFAQILLENRWKKCGCVEIKFPLDGARAVP